MKAQKRRAATLLVKLLCTFSLIYPSATLAAAQNPRSACSPLVPAGEKELDEMGLTGIWRGFISLRTGSKYYAPEYELRLRQHEDGSVSGEGIMKYHDGVANFNLQGIFDGMTFKARSSSYTLVKPYTKYDSDRAFNKCSAVDFDLKLAHNVSVSQEYSYYQLTTGSKPYYEGDVLHGKFAAQEYCDDGGDGVNVLFRVPEVIVVMFGGYGDYEKGNRAVIGLTYPPYVKSLRDNRNYSQYVKYFSYSSVKEAKAYVYQQLKASPSAKIALVGHSLGGNATFELAQALAEDLPELKIDLVITLDPFTCKRNLPRPPMGSPPKLQPQAIPNRPRNIKEWINVYIKLRPGGLNAFLESAAHQWKEQSSADVNILANVPHPQAHEMFYTPSPQLGKLSPADKLMTLVGLSDRQDTVEFMQKLRLLSGSGDGFNQN